MSQEAQAESRPAEKTLEQKYARKSARRHFLSAAAAVGGYIVGGLPGGILVSTVILNRVRNFIGYLNKSRQREYKENSESRTIYGFKELGKSILTLIDPLVSGTLDTFVGLTEYGREKPLYKLGMELEAENKKVKEAKEAAALQADQEQSNQTSQTTEQTEQ